MWKKLVLSVVTLTIAGGPIQARELSPREIIRRIDATERVVSSESVAKQIITTSSGGMLASESRDFIQKARQLSQQAREPVPHYEHRQIGFNYRMSNILAAIGCAQLERLQVRVEQKRAVFERYRAALGSTPGIEFMNRFPRPTGSS